MLHLTRLVAAIALLALSTPLAFCAPDAPEERMRELAAARKLADGLHYQHGHIVLKEGLASLNVPDNFRYLAPADAEIVLSKIWHNPPGLGGLGMLFPADVGPVDPNSYGVVITWAEDGYVKEDDAAKIDYNKILKEMRAATHEANKERKEQGYAAMELVGWAQPPHYDQANHKLYWAKELEVEGASEHTLNYDIRMLGRRGVLELGVIAGMDQLAQIEQAAPSLLEMVDFQAGHRYADFNPSTDKVATYGLAALVTGGILAKAGFFKLLIPALLAAKKLVIVGAVAVVAFLKKLFGGKSESA
jgi:uncharacterized membrane-anchored protein